MRALAGIQHRLEGSSWLGPWLHKRGHMWSWLIMYDYVIFLTTPLSHQKGVVKKTQKIDAGTVGPLHATACYSSHHLAQVRQPTFKGILNFKAVKLQGCEQT